MKGGGHIIFHNTGDFKKTDTFLRRLMGTDPRRIMARYGAIGVERLKDVTPVRTGLTRASWTYKVEKTKIGFALYWENTNLTKDGESIVILLVNGHGTKSGYYVPGRDFVSPAVLPVLEKLGEEMWKELNEVVGRS